MSGGKPTIKLIPPDYLSCQRWFYTPFVMGGKTSRQCGKRPKYILRETIPNPQDGRKGAQSVCADCLIDFKAGNKLKGITIMEIEQKKPSKKRVRK